MYYAVTKDGKKVNGYDDCNGGFPTIDSAVFFIGTDGHVEDENGNLVWSWDEKGRCNIEKKIS